MNLIAPSILSADFSCLRKEIEMIERGGADIIHIDVMDGHFVPNLTIGPVVVSSIRKITKMPFDCHLMIDEPDKYFKRFLDIGIQYISMHVELEGKIEKCMEITRRYDTKFGLAINPETSVAKLVPYLSFVDFVLVMTVHPGFGGQKFIEEASFKIAKLRDMGYEGIIEVDGGINKENVSKVRKMGADIIVSGHFVFGNNVERAIKALR
ncbi:ribulose-phosphate 3-epimerase [candidate division WOR-3 bacterium]|nr:ribulose-phosphate 3-epimerase [candidate division WOR-3 bacterium]